MLPTSRSTVRLFEVGVGQEFQRLHRPRAVQDDAVLVAAVLHDLNVVRGDLGDLVLRIVQVEIDGVGSHIRVQPGKMVAHLATDHRQAWQHLEKCPSAVGGRHHARVLIEHGRVMALAAPVRRIHPVDGVVEIHERLAL